MAVTRYWSRSLFRAIENGVEGTLQWALSAGQHLNPLPQCYDCALVGAVDAGDVRLVELLLKVDGLIQPFLGACVRGPPWLKLPDKAIVLSLNCSLLRLILIRMLEIGSTIALGLQNWTCTYSEAATRC